MIASLPSAPSFQKPTGPAGRELIEQATLEISPATQQPHAVQPGKVRVGRPQRIKAREGPELIRPELAVISEQFERLPLALVVKHAPSEQNSKT